MQDKYKKIKTKKQYVDYYKEIQNVETYAKADLVGASPLITEVEVGSILDVAKRLNISKKGKVLDLATGSGRIIKELGKHFENCTGVDTSKHLLEIARKRTKKSKFLVADIENLPFKSNCFDLITGFRFLINLPQKNRLSIFEEASRVLKHKGILAVNIHLNKLSFRGIRDIVTKSRSPNKLISFFGIKREIESSGLKVVAVHGVNMINLYKILHFLPDDVLVNIDKAVGKVWPINYFSDTFVVYAQKV